VPMFHCALSSVPLLCHLHSHVHGSGGRERAWFGSMQCAAVTTAAAANTPQGSVAAAHALRPRVMSLACTLEWRSTALYVVSQQHARPNAAVWLACSVCACTAMSCPCAAALTHVESLMPARAGAHTPSCVSPGAVAGICFCTALDAQDQKDIQCLDNFWLLRHSWGSL
jgi:hypothetical protein